MHTPLCRQRLAEPVEYARRAVELGLTEIGFSDHSPHARDDFDNWRMLAGQLDEYVRQVGWPKRNFRSSHPAGAGSGIICPARALESATSPRAIPGIISSAPSITFPIRGTLTIPPNCRNGKARRL